MAAHRVDLRHDRDGERRVGFGERDRSAKASTPRANDRDIRSDRFHVAAFPFFSRDSPCTPS
jgi:hypothetical protein